MSVIKLENVTINRANKTVLENVNFEVQTGEFVYLIGKTGMGKSSLLKTLYGDLYLEHGQGEVVGFDLKKLNWRSVPFLRRKMGIVFQDFQLLNDRTVAKNLEFVLKATGWNNPQERQAKIEDVLNKVGLQHKQNSMPFEMSGGEQQRVDIARALLNNPELILADEPTGNLDPDTSEDIMQLLINISKTSDTTIMMSTHDYITINRYPSRVLRIEKQRIYDFPYDEQAGDIQPDLVVTPDADTPQA